MATTLNNAWVADPSGDRGARFTQANTIEAGDSVIVPIPSSSFPSVQVQPAGTATVKITLYPYQDITAALAASEFIDSGEGSMSSDTYLAPVSDKGQITGLLLSAVGDTAVFRVAR